VRLHESVKASYAMRLVEEHAASNACSKRLQLANGFAPQGRC